MIIPAYPNRVQGAAGNPPWAWANSVAPAGASDPWVTAPLGSQYTRITAGSVYTYVKKTDTNADGDWKQVYYVPNMAGLVLWTTARFATTYQGTDTTTPADDDAESVGYWGDRSGNGNNVTQGTGSAKPTYKVNIINSLPALSFDGGDILDTAATVDQVGITIVAVVKTATLAAAFKGIVTSCHNVNNGIALVLHSSNKFAVFSNGNYLQDAVVAASDTAYVLAATHDGATRTLYRDGSAVATGSQSLSSLTNTIRVGGFYVNSASLAWLGHIGEVLVFNRALSAGEITQVTNYMRLLWNTSLPP